MRKYRSIFEAKQVGIVYHYTSYEALLSILSQNSLKAVNHSYISLTRNKINIKSGLKVKIVIDGNKLSNNYRVEPYNYFGDKDIRFDKYTKVQDEQEERVLAERITNLNKYVLEIVVGFNASVFFSQMEKIKPDTYKQKVESLGKSFKIKFINFPSVNWEDEILI